jgi:hypothetical protein
MARRTSTITITITTRSSTTTPDSELAREHAAQENDDMSEVKMGTQYVREIADSFRKAAANCQYPEIQSKLVSLATEMEQLAGKLFFKTQKGTEDMAALAKRLDTFGANLAGKDQAGAAGYCAPIFSEIEQTLTTVKNMKVRMT